MSVADTPRDAVFLHVSASSERQEWRNKTTATTKTRKRHILTHREACELSVLRLYPIKHLIVHFKKHTTRTHVNSEILQSHLIYCRNIGSNFELSTFFWWLPIPFPQNTYHGDIKYIINILWTQFYSNNHRTFLNYFNTWNNMTPDTLAATWTISTGWRR